MMNNKQKHTHKENHGDHHEQDNCEGCQNERKQNNMLVNFYERLGNIETKVDKIKEQVSNQQQTTISYRQKIQKMATVLLKKPELSIQQIKQHNSKEMGYQLASALIQREMKTRLQNQRLQAIIDQLLKDKKKLSDQKQKINEIEKGDSNYMTNQRKKEFFNGQTQYKDALDDVRRTKSIESTYFVGKSKQEKMSNSYFVKEQKKNYWQYSDEHVDTNFTNFASESKKQKVKNDHHNQYAGLNLWLYQFKTDQIDQNPIKSLRKPTKNNNAHLKERKYKSKF